MNYLRTVEEVQEEYTSAMGPNLGQVFYDLFNELSWLQTKWQQYRELFGNTSERVDLLNSAAPIFFGVLQFSSFDDILLHLARLSDPPTSFGHDNLTVRMLPGLIVDYNLRNQVEKIIERVDQSCDFARQWRNRRLAHSDLPTIRNPELLPGASRQSVEDALLAFRELLNTIELHYRSTEVGYELAIEPGGAEMLVYYIEQGLEFERMKLEDLQGGNS